MDVGEAWSEYLNKAGRGSMCEVAFRAGWQARHEAEPIDVSKERVVKLIEAIHPIVFENGFKAGRTELLDAQLKGAST